MCCAEARNLQAMLLLLPNTAAAAAAVECC
jgi:hypothetical protein